ncbi:MAG: Gfo/Idh/MocA family oxidoreductase [Candidatus Hydrogenedentota bacterium]
MNRQTFLRLSLAGLGAGLGAYAQERRTYRACIIGDSNEGGYGHNLHLLWGLRQDVTVVALADPSEEGGNSHATEAQAERVYTDYRKMLDVEKPDLVTIGPRCAHRHLEYMQACIERRCHGVIEKPLAMDLEEIDAIIAAADAKDLKWTIGFNFRVSPIIEHARRLIAEEKIIGDVLEIRARGKEDNRAGGEDLIVLGIHLFDLMRYFLGTPTSCRADVLVEGRPAKPSDVREATEPLGPIAGDSIHAEYRFENGAFGYFASARGGQSDGKRWGLDIFGTKGVVSIRMDTIPKVHWLDDPVWAPGVSGVQWKRLPNAPVVMPGGPPVWHYQPIVDGLMSAIETGGPPRTSLEDARTAHEMIQGVWESLVSGRAADIPLAWRDHPLRRWSA